MSRRRQSPPGQGFGKLICTRYSERPRGEPCSSAGDTVATSAVQTFRTLKTDGPVRFAVVGDTGSGQIGQYHVARALREGAPDLVLHVGDVVYPLFEGRRADLRCFSVYQPQMKSTPFFFVFGNHDLYAGDGDFLEAFHLPTNPVTGTEHFYSFDHGAVHFCGLFVPLRAQNSLFPAYYLGENTPQYRWLTNDLAAATRPWKVLFFHTPLNTSGPHRIDSAGGVLDRVELQRLLLPVAKQYGVQLILTGHDHNFKRFAPMNGVHTVITGGGGAVLYWLYERDPASAQFWSVFHFTRVSVTNDTMWVEAVDTNGIVFDRMVIQRALPAPRVYEASWHSPVLESRPADDGDGNINGQLFDFVGTPIPTLPGQFSNLGRVYVNNDSRYLYLGFEWVMIQGDNNVFLFIESPALAGVTNLAGVGNGIVDPDGQGADGLDFLQNLSFTNFAPAVAALLGDEHGDHLYRYFIRSNLTLNLGQGVFRLDREISEVPGVRLQQFNRSPQTGPEVGEQNADFIEVAIPLDQLGNLRAGDSIKIGAVVGGPGFDASPESQTRHLDSGFLGDRFSGFGQGPCLLGGVTVRLALDPDPDGDGLSSSEESRLGTDPTNPDTDGDGLLDGWEVRFGLNPTSNAGVDGHQGDPDDDGLTNLEEQAVGADPRQADSDGDGLLDGWEVGFQLNAASAMGIHGAGGDPDGDGLSNAQEQIAGTNPRDSASALRLRLRLEPNHRLHLSWDAVVGKRYQLEYLTNWLDGFVAYPGGDFPRTATVTIETFEEQHTPSSAGSRFYRLKLVP